MKDEILEVGKELVIDIAKVSTGVLISIAAGKYVNNKFDKADEKLNPKRKGISKLIHRNSKAVKRTK